MVDRNQLQTLVSNLVVRIAVMVVGLGIKLVKLAEVVRVYEPQEREASIRNNNTEK